MPGQPILIPDGRCEHLDRVRAVEARVREADQHDPTPGGFVAVSEAEMFSYVHHRLGCAQCRGLVDAPAPVPTKD